MKKLKLNWQTSDEGSHDGSGATVVFFAGGFQLYALRKNKAWKITRKWRVWYGDSDEDEARAIKGLTDKWFGTRLAAQRAAERIFVPVLLIAPELIEIETTVKTGYEPRSTKRR